MDRRRFILIGATGSGKSTTGNVLLGRKDAFETSNCLFSCTASVESEDSRVRNWTVVDTPGLADQSAKREDGKQVEESDAERKARLRFNDKQYFEAITSHLREYGGTIIFVHKFGRWSSKLVKHVTALNAVMGKAWASSAVLVLTHVPPSFEIGRNVKEDAFAAKKERYDEWLAQQTHDLEKALSVKFAAVAGLFDGCQARKDHPAHPEQLLTLLESEDLQSVRVEKGVVLLWSEVCDAAAAKLDFAKVFQDAAAKTDADIKDWNKKKENYSGTLSAIEPGATFVRNAQPAAVAAAAAALALASIPTAGIAAGVVALIGGSAVVAAHGVPFVLQSKIAGANRRIEDLNAQLAEQKALISDILDGDGVEELKRLPELVYGQ